MRKSNGVIVAAKQSDAFGAVLEMPRANRSKVHFGYIARKPAGKVKRFPQTRKMALLGNSTEALVTRRRRYGEA